MHYKICPIWVLCLSAGGPYLRLVLTEAHGLLSSEYMCLFPLPWAGIGERVWYISFSSYGFDDCRQAMPSVAPSKSLGWRWQVQCPLLIYYTWLACCFVLHTSLLASIEGCMDSVTLWVSACCVENVQFVVLFIILRMEPFINNIENWTCCQ